MIPHDIAMREITNLWDEFCRSQDTKQELLETAIGKSLIPLVPAGLGMVCSGPRERLTTAA